MSVPLVSCIMPTRGRSQFVRQAHRLWVRQTWPERELIVVADEDDPETIALVDEIAMADARVRVVRVLAGTTLGAKRNAAVEAAAGEYIAHNDDDDWFGPRRLELQVGPLIAGESEMNELPLHFVLDLLLPESWVIPRRTKRLTRHEGHAATLMYQRALWPEASYPSVNHEEDVGFIERAAKNWLFLWNTVEGGARINVLNVWDQFVYVRHPWNVWRSADDGRRAERELAGWRPTRTPISEDDLVFYRERSAAIRAEWGPARVTQEMR